MGFHSICHVNMVRSGFYIYKQAFNEDSTHGCIAAKDRKERFSREFFRDVKNSVTNLFYPIYKEPI